MRSFRYAVKSFGQPRGDCPYIRHYGRAIGSVELRNHLGNHGEFCEGDRSVKLQIFWRPREFCQYDRPVVPSNHLGNHGGIAPTHDFFEKMGDMVYDPDRHHRRSIRLKNYDYSQEGAYFITICIQHRQPLLGDIEKGEMQPNLAGQMVQQVWNELRSRYSGVDLDAFTLMPNHIHGILLFASPNDSAALILGDIIHRFKSLTTAKYRQGVHQQNWQPFIGKLWQRNYYEHIIRDSDSLKCIRNYITQNPKLWRCDRLHPNQPKTQRNNPQHP